MRYGVLHPFKPPAYKPSEPPMWATYIATRVPQWKIHSGGAGRGHGQAINAIKYEKKRGGVVYKLVDNVWHIAEWYEGPGTIGAMRPGMCAECEGQVWDDDAYLCIKCKGLTEEE